MSNGVIYTHLMKMMASGGERVVAQLYLSCKIHCEESSQYKKFSAKGEMKECLFSWEGRWPVLLVKMTSFLIRANQNSTLN